MRDLVAAVAHAIGFLSRRIGVERCAHCAVADGMGMQLQPGLVGLNGDGFELLRREQQLAAFVAADIGFEQRGGAGLDDAVDKELERGNLEAGRCIALLELQRARHAGGSLVRLDLDRRLDPQRELAGLIGALVAVEHPGFGGRVDEGGDAVAKRLGLRRLEAGVDLAVRVFRQQLADQFHGAFAQQAGRVAGGVALDAAAFGILAAGVDAGGLERRRIGPAGMAVYRADEHRPVAGHLVEHRRIAVRKGRDVPAGAADPRALGQVVNVGCLDRLAHALPVDGFPKPDVERLGGTPDQVVVGILEARQHQRVGRQVVDGRAVEVRRYVLARANGSDASIDQGDGAGFRPGCVHRQDARAAQDDGSVFGESPRATEEEHETGGAEAGPREHTSHDDHPAVR